MEPAYNRQGVTIYCGDALQVLRDLPDESVHCCVSSPPYWGLRDYGVDGQLGLEPTPQEYVAKLVAIYEEVRRVLRTDGTCWVNLGDCYNAYNGGAGPSSSISQGAQTKARPMLDSGFGLRAKNLKPKDLVGIPWMVAFALRDAGWYLRQDIIWAKPNPMPESVRDRCTKSHEYIFLLSKSRRYYFDGEAIAEPVATATAERYKYDFGGAKSEALVEANKNGIGQRTRPVGKRCLDNTGRNKRSVWTINPQPYPAAHFATFPKKLIEPCILAGCPEGGTVLDPFLGSGTTAEVARGLGRQCIGIELNPEYVGLCENRLAQGVLF